MADVDAIKRDVNILEIIVRDTDLKRVASTHGGEWAGACPFCGGDDRFRVQPYHPDGGRWFCRGCGDEHWHDVIDYIQTRDHVPFVEALEHLNPGGEYPRQKREETAPEVPQENDRHKWVSTAFEFIEQSVSHLWGDEGKAARDYLSWRGLNDDSLHHWAIGYNPADGYGDPQEWGLPKDQKVWLPRGIVIPCQDAAGLHYLKIRRREGEPKYFIIKGGAMWPYGMQTYTNAMTGFLFEGEFDTMLAYQTGFTGVGYASIPAGQILKIEYQPFFETIIDVIVAFDNDVPGQLAADKICKLSHFHRAQPFPQGKDLTEYYQFTGSLESVFEWLYSQIGNL